MTRPDLIAQARALEAEGLSDYEVSRRMGRSSSWWAVTRARAGLERLPRPPSDRTARVTALVTPEERDALADRASAAGLSVSDYVREQCGLDRRASGGPMCACGCGRPARDTCSECDP